MSTAFIGLDLAKSVFQVHGVDVHGKVVMTKRLRRDAGLAFFANLPVCVVGMEACAGSHFWARDHPARPHGASDGAAVRQALREAPQERPGRCRSDLRGDATAEHAVRHGQDRGAAEHLGDPPGARDAVQQARCTLVGPEQTCFWRLQTVQVDGARIEIFKGFNQGDITSNFLCSRNQRPGPIDAILFPVLKIEHRPDKSDDDRYSGYKLTKKTRPITIGGGLKQSPSNFIAPYAVYLVRPRTKKACSS
jgi:hypothetical protein